MTKSMINLRFVLTLTTAVLLLSSAASAMTYYVSSAGADTNNGTAKTTPWAHAPGMVGCVSTCATAKPIAGDRIILRGGDTWTVANFQWWWRWSGTSGNNIYIGVDQTWFVGTSWARPVFDLSGGIITGTASAVDFIPMFMDGVNYITIDNLEIKNQQMPSSWSFPYRSAIVFNGGGSSIIENCYIHGWHITGTPTTPDVTGGIAEYNNAYHLTVTGNLFDGAPDKNTGVGLLGGEVVTNNVCQNMTNCIHTEDVLQTLDVHGNVVANLTQDCCGAHGNAIYVFGGGKIYNNMIHDVFSGYQAIYLETMWTNTANTQYVYNNVCWNIGNAPCIGIENEGHNVVGSTNTYIYNNSMTGAGIGSSNWGSFCIGASRKGTYPPTNVSIRNNFCISDQTSIPAYCFQPDGGGNANCAESFTSLIESNNSNITTAQAASQGYTMPNQLRPSSGSVSSVGVGVNLTTSCSGLAAQLCVDKAGAARPSTGTWDTGAYQFGPASLTPPSQLRITIQ